MGKAGLLLSIPYLLVTLDLCASMWVCGGPTNVQLQGGVLMVQWRHCPILDGSQNTPISRQLERREAGEKCLVLHSPAGPSLPPPVCPWTTGWEALLSLSSQEVSGVHIYMCLRHLHMGERMLQEEACDTI